MSAAGVTKSRLQPRLTGARNHEAQGDVRSEDLGLGVRALVPVRGLERRKREEERKEEERKKERKKGRKEEREKGRKKGRKEERKKGRKEERKKGRKEKRSCESRVAATHQQTPRSNLTIEFCLLKR